LQQFLTTLQDFSGFINSFGSFAMLRAVGLHVLRYAPDRSVYLFAPAPGVEDASLRAQVALEGLQQQLSLPEPKAWHVFQFMKSCTKKYYDVINVLHESM